MENKNPIFNIEYVIPNSSNSTDRMGFAYLLDKVTQLEKMQSVCTESQSKHSDSSATPLWLKYSLSIQEASDYFGIGIGRLRHIICVNPNADFVLEIGAHVRIKRQLFEQYLNRAGTV